jgi:hypothetical protein
MPRASHLVALDVRPRQWPFLMSAGIVQGKERALDLKDVLRGTMPDRGDFVHGRLPLGGPSTATQFGTSMPVAGAVHGVNNGHLCGTC